MPWWQIGQAAHRVDEFIHLGWLRLPGCQPLHVEAEDLRGRKFFARLKTRFSGFIF